MLQVLCFTLVILTINTQGATFGVNFAQILQGDDGFSGEVEVPLNFDPPKYADEILGRARNVSDFIAGLTEEISALRASISNNFSKLEIEDLEKQLGKLNETFDAAQQKFDELKNEFEEVTRGIDESKDTLMCFAETACITKGPPTTASTTTAMSPRMCVPRNGSLKFVQNNTWTTQSPDFPEEVLYNCYFFVKGAAGIYFTITGNLMITRNALLQFIDEDTGEIIESYNKSQSILLKTKSKYVGVFASTEERSEQGYSTIAYNLTFSIVGICEGFDCGYGDCYVNAQNQAKCSCTGCFSSGDDEKCSIKRNPCSPAFDRRCKGKPCVADPRQPDKCIAVCQCSDTEYATTC